MKKISLLLVVLISFISCDKSELDYYEANQTIANFVNSTDEVVFNPSEDIDNTYSVVVSTLSDQDRIATISIAEESNVDPSSYTLDTTEVLIPAGSYSGDFTITTPSTAAEPAEGEFIVINLDAIDGGRVIPTLESSSPVIVTLIPAVGCAFSPDESTGTHNAIVDAFGVFDPVLEVVSGPGENQITIQKISTLCNEGYDIIVDIDPILGNAVVAQQPAWEDCFTGQGYGTGSVAGSGKVLSCLNTIELTLTHTVAAGSFGSYDVTLVKN